MIHQPSVNNNVCHYHTVSMLHVFNLGLDPSFFVMGHGHKSLEVNNVGHS
jgi:hypothetical protein